MNKTYHIYSGYKHRDKFVDCPQIDRTDKFQNEVYETAKKLFMGNHFSSVLDIGCGSAYKLIKYFKDENFVGLEVEPNLSFIRDKYPYYNFGQSDFNNPPKEKFDMIICSDVVEHLLYPDDLMEFINKIDFKFLVISTPDREIIQKVQRAYGWPVEKDGPLHNVMHIREWSSTEFIKYISDYFNVNAHFLAPIQKECQILIANKMA